MAQLVCQYSKYVHCKKGRNYCKSIHFSEICEEDNCETYNCDKRHPKECNNFSQFQKCVFFNCSYRHISPPTNKDIQELRNRIKDLENKQIKAISIGHNCELCDYSSKNEKKLKQHIRKNHKEMQLNLTIEEDCVECNLLKPKVEALEKYVLKIEEKLELEIEKLKTCEDTVLEIIADDEVTEDDLTVAMIEKHENSSAASNVNLVLNCENIDMSLES